MEDTVDPSVGFVISAKPGARVEKGQKLGEVHARDQRGVAAGMAILEKAIVLGDGVPVSLPLVSHRVTATGVEEL
jgi:pyrimidine-nucleoside phosphorylase